MKAIDNFNHNNGFCEFVVAAVPRLDSAYMIDGGGREHTFRKQTAKANKQLKQLQS
jgi:hypothetical protein